LPLFVFHCFCAVVTVLALKSCRVSPRFPRLPCLILFGQTQGLPLRSINVPSLWGGLGRGLTLLVFSGGHIGPHPTKRLQRTGHAQSLQINSFTPDFFTPEQGTRKGCPYTACAFGRANLAPTVESSDAIHCVPTP
jgi:hypothetical protein